MEKKPGRFFSVLLTIILIIAALIWLAGKGMSLLIEKQFSPENADSNAPFTVEHMDVDILRGRIQVENFQFEQAGQRVEAEELEIQCSYKRPYPPCGEPD